jgi:hypothetical protein
MDAVALTARDVEAAAVYLERSRSRIRGALWLAATCAVIAFAVSPWDRTVAIAVGGGAVAGFLIASTATLSRKDRIARLALDPFAYELPEVASYAHRLARQLERERLADWILEILREAASLPGNRYVVPRVIRYADQLAALSDDLADPTAEIHPASAAAAHLLLTQAVDSPLYNPTLPDDLLPATITKIRLGISRPPV